jgi:hypothetical protein
MLMYFVTSTIMKYRNDKMIHVYMTKDTTNAIDQDLVYLIVSLSMSI